MNNTVEEITSEYVVVQFNFAFTVPNNPNAIARAKEMLENDIRSAAKNGGIQGYCEEKEAPSWASDDDLPEWFQDDDNFSEEDFDTN